MDLRRIRARMGHVPAQARWGLALMVAVSMSTFVVQARTPSQEPPAPTGTAFVSESSLPTQGRAVMELVRQGGPFQYGKDGTVFGNRERLLPGERRGFYREYTVPTPGLTHRGAKRIVCGGWQPKAPDACYYTEDHYSSFRLIVR